MSDQSYTYTVVTANTPIGKIFDADLVNTNEVNSITRGEVQVWTGTIDEIAETLDELTGHECLITGVPRDGIQEHALCIEALEVPGAVTRDTGLPILAKTNENYVWPNEPGLLFFDHDPAHWTRDPLTTVGEVIDMIGRSLGINLWDFDFVAKPSSSSCVLDGDGNEVRGIHGVHVYVGVKSLACLRNKRGEHILDKAAELGLSCGVISASGAFLKRGVFDSSLHKSPQSVVYAGAAQFLGEHTSDRQVVINNKGLALDLAVLINGVDHGKAEAQWAKLRTEMKPEQERVQAEYVTTRVAMGIPEDVVRAALTGGKLDGSWLLTRDDGSTVTAVDAFMDPGTYHGMAIRDPLEPEYGPGKAKIYISQGNMRIHSFAHGDKVYDVVLGAESFREALQSCPKDSTSWRSLAGLLDGVKPPDAAHIVRAEIDDAGNQGAVSSEVGRLIREVQGQRRSDDTGHWASDYAYLTAGGGSLVNLAHLNLSGKVSSMKPSSFNIRYGLVRGPDGEPASNWAVGSELIPSYDALRFTPPETLFGAIPRYEHQLNAWRGGPDFPRTDVAPHLWLQLVTHMFPNKKEREVLLDWLAFALQFPGVKCNWQILVKSVEGTGKDTMVAPLRWAMGLHNFKEVETKDLLSDFNSYLLGCPSMLVIEELDAAHKSECRTRLKPLAATPPHMLSVNIKHEQPVDVSNTCAVLVFTNENHPFSLDIDDRRWVFLEANNIKKSPAFFTQLWAWYEAGGKPAVAGWLLNRDLSAFDPNHLPMTTDLKASVQELSRTGYQMAVEEYLADQPGVECVRPSELASHATKLSGENITGKQIMTALNNLGWSAVFASEKGKGRARCMISPELKAKLDAGSTTLAGIYREHFGSASPKVVEK